MIFLPFEERKQQSISLARADPGDRESASDCIPHTCRLKSIFLPARSRAAANNERNNASQGTLSSAPSAGTTSRRRRRYGTARDLIYGELRETVARHYGEFLCVSLAPRLQRILPPPRGGEQRRTEVLFTPDTVRGISPLARALLFLLACGRSTMQLTMLSR